MKKNNKHFWRPQGLSVQQQRILDAFQSNLRAAAIVLVNDLFLEEVKALCGALFQHKKGRLCRRGGSEKGSVMLQGQRLSVRRPRVRRGGGEVPLASYQALRRFDLLSERVAPFLLSGVSTRNYNGLLDEWSQGLGLRRSSVSKAFKRGSLKALDELNGRDLSAYRFVNVMIDGIEFGGRMAVCGLGITEKGEKVVLGLRQGDTENSGVCADFLQSLLERGLSRGPFLWTIDGSKALRKAVCRVFGQEALVQRCVRHKERNIEGYLPKAHHQEFRRRWKLLHGSADFQGARREHECLRSWLGRRNLEAKRSLEEAGGETLTAIQLKCPALLRRTLMSTNPIESAFSMVRERTGRVKNWGSGPDQAARWAAAALLEAEKRFQTVRGFREIPLFVKELNRFSKKAALKARPPRRRPKKAG